MIALKEAFMDRYLIVLVHKLRQEFNERLPDTDFLVNMQLKADDIVREIVREVR